MNRKRKIRNIELRSEEVQKLMGKIPPAIMRIGNSVMLILLIFVFIASNLIKYPDTITIPIVAKNVNYLSEIKVPKHGKLIESHMKRGHAFMGGTIAKVAVINGGIIDTACILSPFTGVVHPCDVFQENDYVVANDVLCVVADSIKDVITAKASVSVNLKKKIMLGMEVESYINANVVHGKIVSIANCANPSDGTYRITIIFEKSKELENTIVWDCHTDARIKINGQTLFEKIFKDSSIRRKH